MGITVFLKHFSGHFIGAVDMYDDHINQASSGT